MEGDETRLPSTHGRFPGDTQMHPAARTEPPPHITHSTINPTASMGGSVVAISGELSSVTPQRGGSAPPKHLPWALQESLAHSVHNESPRAS